MKIYKDEMLAAVREHPGLLKNELAELLGIPATSAGDCLSNLRRRGHVLVQGGGHASRWYAIDSDPECRQRVQGFEERKVIRLTKSPRPMPSKCLLEQCWPSAVNPFAKAA